jgi:hypothetical protein
MFWHKVTKPTVRIALAIALIGVVAFSALAFTTPTQAHCDSAKGPVATAASKVRKQGTTARQLADRYFIETAVRLHRAGEGAPFTGVTDEETPASILTADRAMASGSVTEVNTILEQAMRKGVEAKYQAVVNARAEAKRLNTVEAHRERVEAELMFEKYIYELNTLASSTEALTEGHAH